MCSATISASGQARRAIEGWPNDAGGSGFVIRDAAGAQPVVLPLMMPPPRQTSPWYSTAD